MTQIDLKGEIDSTTLPPGPRLPSVVVTALRLSSFWSRCSERWRDRYGSAYTWRMAFVGRTVVQLSDPADIKTLFAGDPTIFHAGEANEVLTGLLGESSLLVVDEDVHRDRRRLMVAPFSHESVSRQAGVMAEIAVANMSNWPAGVEFPVSPRMAEITLEIIMRAVMGATHPAVLDDLREALGQIANVSAFGALCILHPNLQRHRPWRGVVRRIAEADRLLYALIADTRTDPDLASRTDALAQMVRATDDHGRALTDQELRDQLMTLLVVGHDTTTAGLAWAMERLVRYPEVLQKARAAADASAAGDRAGDQYLDALVKETLRIRPVLRDAARTLTRPTDVAGYRMPAGVNLGVSIGLIHSNPEQYPHPERFDPDRMLRARLSPHKYLPFGGGNRRCLGASFAQVEMRVVLKEVLRRFDLSTTTARGERERVRAGVHMPARGARIRINAIRDTPSAPMAGHASCPFSATGT
jgi:cytochrome P450